MRLFALALAVAALGTMAACGGDQASRSWSDGWAGAERSLDDGRHEEALRAFEELGQAAATGADRAFAARGRARALAALNRVHDALRGYEAEGRGAARRVDRARARYEAARLVDAVGRKEAARRMYRRVVDVYPNLMPGERALTLLEAEAWSAGPAALEEHLRWSRVVYGKLRDTSLGDDLLFFAAGAAASRGQEAGSPHHLVIAEDLYRIIGERYRHTEHGDDALWELSGVLERDGRYGEAIRVLRTIQSDRRGSTFLGRFDSPFRRLATLRVARIQLERLRRPRAAAATYGMFVEAYPESRWRDDALFWKGCAEARSGHDGDAELAFAALAAAHPESKYVGRIARARVDAHGDVCTAPALASRGGP